jgi:hypothetical protein
LNVRLGVLLHNLVWVELSVALNFRIVKLSSNKSLYIKDCVFRICSCLQQNQYIFTNEKLAPSACIAKNVTDRTHGTKCYNWSCNFQRYITCMATQDRDHLQIETLAFRRHAKCATNFHRLSPFQFVELW